MTEVGMRVSDAIRYNPVTCVFDESRNIWAYTFEPVRQRTDETPTIATVYFTSELKLAIDNCEWFSKAFPFAYRTFVEDDSTQEAAVYERMQAIGTRCGIKVFRPHRLRHTFAWVMLKVHRVGLEALSKLLYHAHIATTEKYYAPWCDERQEIIADLMSQAFKKTNKPSLGDFVSRANLLSCC
jgi:integrase